MLHVVFFLHDVLFVLYGGRVLELVMMLGLPFLCRSLLLAAFFVSQPFACCLCVSQPFACHGICLNMLCADLCI